ncbi:MAG TPA: RNA helicase [Bacteroidia bacterium]|nr:RNA helicase [Bacteroidia bacterium]
MEKKTATNGSHQTEKKETCGIIMPISSSDGYPESHWSEVRAILEEVINNSGFNANMVSDADEIGIIHNRIIQNVINNPIIICDVSSKNPNVMFELGLRLAFDKAAIIIKDDQTNYNFDTSPIEHLTYPKDLRYATINKFKEKLSEKIKATYNASKKPEYSTFLKHFVQYKPKIETQEIGSSEFIIKLLQGITNEMSVINSNLKSTKNTYISRTPSIKINDPVKEYLFEFMKANKIEDINTLPDKIDDFSNFIADKTGTFISKEYLNKIVKNFILTSESAF